MHATCKTSEAKSVLAIEMVARVCKRELKRKIREKMQLLKFPLGESCCNFFLSNCSFTPLYSFLFWLPNLETPYTEVTVNYLNNTILNPTKKIKDIETGAWKPCPEQAELYELIPKIYDYKEDPTGEPLSEQIKKYPMGWQLTFDRIRTLLGLKISKKYLPQLASFHEILLLTF